MSVCKSGSVLTYSPFSPLLMPQDISPVGFYCIMIQEILLSPSFSPSHPTKMFSNTRKLKSMRESELQMITEKRLVAVFRLSDIQKSQVAKLWPRSWWFYGMV